MRRKLYVLTVIVGIVFSYVFYIPSLNAQDNITSIGIIDFMNKLFRDYHPQIQSEWGSHINNLVLEAEIDDAVIKESILELYFWHELFTCATCVDGNNSGIWKIPYFWHWQTPNKRCDIITLPDSTRLENITPPEEYSLYESFAYIDRKPLIYLTDLYTNPDNYYYNLCGKFKTFGWCSEREMAFNALLYLKGVEAKVFADGNHSWSEVYIPYNNSAVTIKIDNTFDGFSVLKISNLVSLEDWKKKVGDNPSSEWYNRKARDPQMLEKLKKVKVSQKNAVLLEKMIKNYFSIP